MKDYDYYMEQRQGEQPPEYPEDGLHPCSGCGVELDGDDPNTLCEECR